MKIVTSAYKVSLLMWSQVLELAKQHIETRRGANDEHEYVSGTETPALELTSSQIDFVACQFLFLEISIRDQLVQSCSDEEVQVRSS